MKFLQKKLSLSEQARIARRLSTLLGAGISLPDAIRFMKRPVFAPILKDVSKGRRCSEAFRSANVFDLQLIGMIRIGERSGTLADALSSAAESLESRDALSRKITGAMVYPGFIACATAGIAGFLVVYIFPKIIPLVVGMGIPLPALTRMVLAVSDALIYHWGILAASVIAAFVLVRIFWKYSAFFRNLFRNFVFILPIIGSISRGRIIADIFSSLGLLVGHGELVPAGLASVSKGMRHEAYARGLILSSKLVSDGESLAAALVRISPRLFPRLVTDFIEIGERTGNMASTCGHIAAIYEGEVEESIKRVTQLIEPTLMLGMGLTVGSIALSIVMPIYAITSNLTK